MAVKQLTADLVGGCELAFPMILERLDGRWFQIGSVTTNGYGARLAGSLAAATHARMEAESTLVQIGMRQSVDDVDSFLGIENEHLAEKMDGLVCGLRR